MMEKGKPIRRFLVCFVFLLSLGRAGGDGGATPTTVPTPEVRADETGLHVIVSVKGQLGVKRIGWSNYAPAFFGTSLRRGDLLRLEGQSEAKVVCAELTVSDVPSGTGGVPCSTSKPVLHYRDDLAVSTRSYGSISFPMIISPRKTKLLNPHPTLRWTPVNGVTTYTVIVRGPDLHWSTTVGSTTELVYPKTAPALKPKIPYKLIVIAGGRRSDEESVPDLGFTVLPSNTADDLRREEKKIRALGLSDVQTRLIVAHLYIANGLNSEAIEQLEQLSTALKEPALARLLGGLYLAAGLPRHAEERYSIALSLSEKMNDEEGLCLAHRALGTIYEALGNKIYAAQHLKPALESSRRLGDQGMIKQIEELLVRLK